MPIIDLTKPNVDKTGTPIFPGDILQSTHEATPETYFVCFVRSVEDMGLTAEIRDLNNNNLYTCALGKDGDVVNIGHFSKHLDLLSNEDLKYHFGIDLELAAANNCDLRIIGR